MFKSVPGNTHKSIPFKQEVPELSVWLHEKLVDEKWSSCREVFNALQAVNEQKMEPKQKFVLLEGINAYIRNFTKRAENSYLESTFPLSSKNLAHIELITWIYAELAKGYFDIVNALDDQKEHVLSEQRQALVLYRALQTSGQAFLHISEVYMEPYQGFWQQCYQIYTKAERLGVLDLEINGNGIKSETVNMMFKHILVFDLCDTNQFRASEMRTIYQFLGGFVGYAVIFSGRGQINNEQGVNWFQPGQDTGPLKLTNNAPAENEDIRYISSVKVAKKIYQCLQEGAIGKGVLKAINTTLFLQIIKALGKVQRRRHTRIKEGRNCSVIIGIHNVISYLHIVESENKAEIEKSNVNLNNEARLAGIWKVPDLDLVPLGDEIGLQLERKCKYNLNRDVRVSKIINAAKTSPEKKGIWDQNVIEQSKLKSDVESDEFEILDSSMRGYNASCKAGNIKVRIGEVFAIVEDSGSRVEVGLIRRISLSSGDELQLGIELIGLEGRLVCLSRRNDDSAVWAILLSGEEVLQESDSVLFESGNFLSGEFVDLRQGRLKTPCRLKKLLHATPSVSHAEVNYLNMSR